MAEVVRGALAHEMDTNKLFKKYTIEEIREIEKKTRSDIERKKEDLRQMVGERYRELIEAADTITDMKNSAENVMQSISSMQELCQNLRQKHMVKGSPSMTHPRKDTQRKKEEAQFYGVAAQIKLLLDMPEKMWSAVDSRNYLQATCLFLLARHVNTGLQMDSQQSAKILTWFPVLTRQWTAICHFRNTILQICRDTLQESSMSEKLTAECLCSILLLEDSTPRQVFNEFLLIRTNAVQRLFQPDQSEVSIKSQVCNVVSMIITTVHQIYAVFYSDVATRENNEVPSNLLMCILERVTSKTAEGAIICETHTSKGMKYLPQSVQDFRPSLRNHAAAISPQNLQENCQQWINTCIQTVSTGMGKLLGFITTVRGLASIRDEIWQLLKEDKKMTTWNGICENVLDRKLKIWEEFFQSHFVDRNKALLQSQFDSALGQAKQQIAKVLSDLGNLDDRTMHAERNLSSYVWVEGPQDIPKNSAWVPIGSRTLADSGTLLMKARAYTPAVQMLCCGIDGKLKVLLDDASHYLQQPKNEPSTIKKQPFDKFADNDAIKDFIRNTCEASVHRLLDHLADQVQNSRDQLTNSTDLTGNQIILDRVLLLGRMSSALCELSTHLEQCMLGGMEKPEGTRSGKKLISMKSKSQTSENPSWTKMKLKMHQFSLDSYSLWTGHMSQVLVTQFQSALLDSNGAALLRATTRWDSIEIQEETEEGKTVKSTIKVPMQVSWYVQSLLYELCGEVNRVGGHALHRSSLQSLVQQLSDGLVSAYEDVMSKNQDRQKSDGACIPFSQSRALQLLFDLRFLTNIIPRKEENEANKKYQIRVQTLIDKLEGFVDPFDLDVFTPYINARLARHTQRSSVLYGALTSLDRHGMYVPTHTTHTGHQEEHNVLRLSTNQSRFPLLPLSIQSRSHIPPPILQSPKTQISSIPLGPGSPPPLSPTSPGLPQSSSFLGTVSTIWFSNVGGGGKSK